MYAHLHSFSLSGLEAEAVDVEVSISPGLPRFEIIGLADAAIRESRERIFQSMRQYGFEIPPGNITVNLAPAERRKRGAGFDLPIAIGILTASGQIPPSEAIQETLISGELSLDGRLKPCAGWFNAALSLSHSYRGLLYPESNRNELTHFRGIHQFPVTNLDEAIQVIKKERSPVQISPPDHPGRPHEMGLDYNQVWGHASAIQAIQIALLARMNLLLVGPPGCGKTLLLRRIPTLFEPLPEAESLEVTRIHAAGGHAIRHLIPYPPFREVHSGVSEASLVGGGLSPTPGEISLSHLGVLFLDELAEFPRGHLQALRTPLVEKRITVSRLSWQMTFPADFQLAAAMNPCPCGHTGSSVRPCLCSDRMRRNYLGRISGPLLDRIDLILQVQPPHQGEVFQGRGESSESIRQRMSRARRILSERPHLLSSDYLRTVLDGKASLQSILKDSYQKGLLSLRRSASALRTAMAMELLSPDEDTTPGGLHPESLLAAISYCRNRLEGAMI